MQERVSRGASGTPRWDRKLTNDDVIVSWGNMRHLDLHAPLVEIESLGKGVICEIHI